MSSTDRTDRDRTDPDTHFMREALALARRGLGRTNPNPAVGALVVREGAVAARGHHARAGGPHAEVVALDQAGEAARGATLYVTLEPCCHHGRTPPCTDRIVAAGIRRVVYAVDDPNPRVRGAGASILRAARIEVEAGVMPGPARAVNEGFFHFMETGRPFVTLKLALSLDGRMAAADGSSRWITGPATRRMVHRLRREADAILVGIGTVLRDDPSLTVRLGPVSPRAPARVVLDPSLRLPPSARVLDPVPGSALLIMTRPGNPEARRRALAARGAEILEIAPRDAGLDLAIVLEALGRREMSRILVEGGPTLATALLREGRVDKLVACMAPVLLGGPAAGTGLGDLAVGSIDEAWRLDRLTWHRHGPDRVAVGYPRRWAE